MNLIERYRGALLGLAAGDALGTTLEFKTPGSFAPIDTMVGGGPFQLQAGQWTDDTSMALCLATSLVECHGFDPRDQMERYLRWWRTGYLSSTGSCFDIGGTVATALRRFEANAEPFAGSVSPDTAGNGSIMRLAPVPLFFAGDPRLAIERAADSSRTTHASATAIDACRYLAGLILGALLGSTKDQLLSPCYCPLPGYWQEYPLHPAVEEVASGSFRRKNPPAIRGTGYVVDSLEAALWAFYHGGSFQEGCRLAVNLGDDADTTGAVFGQLAGAYYGESAIPPDWRRRLAMAERIGSLAEQIYRLAQSEDNTSLPLPVEHAPASSRPALEVPIPDSYWVLPGRLLAGEYPGARDEEQAQVRLRAFLQAGVSFFLDLTEVGELRPYEPLLGRQALSSSRSIEYRRMPIRDMGVPSVDQMMAILATIDTALAAGHVVYAHCWGGIGRTGTVIGCYLVQCGSSASEVLETIRRLRRGTPDGRRVAPETRLQQSMVLEWRSAKS